MTAHFGELLTAMVTPFREDREVNYEQVRKMARYLVDNGSDGLVVLGTTGEVPTLDRKEKLKILQTAVDEVGESAKIVAGTGSYNTAASIELTEEAEKIGVDGIMLVTPYYNKPPQEGLYRHFSMIAEHTSLPVMVYNVPGRTSRNIEVKTLKRLSKVENIRAVKEASGDINQISEICRVVGDDFYVYSGDDKVPLPLLAVGGHGVVSVAAHLVGNKIKKMIQTYKQGDVNRAAELNQKLLPVFSGMFLTTNPIPVKTALNMQGKNVGPVRPPLINMNESEREVLEDILTKQKLL